MNLHWIGKRRELIPTPADQVDPASNDEFDWQATGSQPRFNLVAVESGYPEGWVDVQFELVGERGSKVGPCIYVDHGYGDLAASKVRLPDPVDGRVRALVRFPKPVHALRLVPTDRPCQFSLGRVSVRQLTSLEAGVRLALPYSKPLLCHPSRLPGALRNAYALWHQQGLWGIKRQLAGEMGSASAISYPQWIQEYDSLSDWDIQRIRQRLKRLERQPLISIVLPVEQGLEPALEKAIESVRAQLYPHWQLCIAGTASAAARAGALVEKYSRDDLRISAWFSPSDSPIADLLNQAAERTRGEFVAALRESDRLRPHALYMLIEEINASPSATLIYSDEDEIGEADQRCQHHFKPDWNPDLFHSYNYLSHLTAIARSLIETVGRWRGDFEKCEEYDFLLRCVSHCPREQIRHIPHVLYHARALATADPEELCASRDSERSNCRTLRPAPPAAVEALRGQLGKLYSGIEVTPGRLPHLCRVRYPLPDPPPLASIIIPTKDRLPLLERCLESIFSKTDYSRFEIIIVDNQSTDPSVLGYLEKLQSSRTARVLKYCEPFNYSAINNLAARHARGEVLAFLNNDLEVISADWLSEMASVALRPEVGAVGALLYYPDDRIQHAGLVLGMHGRADHVYRGLRRGQPGYDGRALATQNVSAVTGACAVIRRSLFEQLKGFDEQLAVAFNDLDLCLRLRSQGYLNVWTPYAELYHHESASRGRDDSRQKQQRLYRETEIMTQRWGAMLDDDPYFNPNLSLDHVYPSLAQPPRTRRPWDIPER